MNIDLKLISLFTELTHMTFAAALFVMAPDGELSECLSTCEWVNEVVCVQIMEYPWAVKSKERLAYITTRVTSDNEGRRQTQSSTYGMTPLTRNSRKGHVIVAESDRQLAGAGELQTGFTAKEPGGALWGS